MWQKRRLAAAHAALEAAHAELAAAHARLAEKARRDGMTGVLNRESFFEAVEAARPKHPTSALLIVDADHFKSINDGHGHLIGDDALIEITGAICRGGGGRAVVGRLGGEEFGVLLAGAGMGEARVAAEKIRRQVEEVVFRPEARRIALTVSIGCAAGQPERTLSELLREADRRLYEAKRRGRNKVVAGDYPIAA